MWRVAHREAVGEGRGRAHKVLVAGSSRGHEVAIGVGRSMTITALFCSAGPPSRSAACGLRLKPGAHVLNIKNQHSTSAALRRGFLVAITSARPAARASPSNGGAIGFFAPKACSGAKLSVTFTPRPRCPPEGCHPRGLVDNHPTRLFFSCGCTFPALGAPTPRPALHEVPPDACTVWRGGGTWRRACWGAGRQRQERLGLFLRNAQHKGLRKAEKRCLNKVTAAASEKERPYRSKLAYVKNDVARYIAEYDGGADLVLHASVQKSPSSACMSG